MGAEPRGVAITDLDGYCNADIATANWATGTASVLRNAGRRHVHEDYPMAAGPVAIVTPDLNGDGNPDLVVADQGSAS